MASSSPEPTTDSHPQQTAQQTAQQDVQHRPHETPHSSQRGGQQDQRRGRLPRVTDEDIAGCRTPEGLIRALAILGLINDSGDAVICPQCHKTSDLKKFSIKPDGGYKHFGADGCWGGKGAGIDLLQAEPLALTFPDAVRAIVGKPTVAEVKIPDQLPQISIKSFKAKIDHEVYHGVLTYGRKTGGVEAAIAHYGQWHIDPDVVRATGAVYISDPAHFEKAILARYGIDRLVACGLFVMVPVKKGSEEERPMCLVSKKWPVIEPAFNADGHVVNMQFRASDAQYAKYLAHKAGKLPYEGNQKFINIRGNDPGAVGIDAAAQLPEGTTVYVVEGFKDRAAGMTLGGHYVAFPGTGYRPNKAELEVLRRLDVVLMFDGDEAGQKAVNGVVRTENDGTLTLVKPGMWHYLAEHDIAAKVAPLTGDMDVTDRLVERHARGGCTCNACSQMRERLAI